jgi:hypothetical protein
MASSNLPEEKAALPLACSQYGGLKINNLRKTRSGQGILMQI